MLPRHSIPRLDELHLVIETGRLRLRPFVEADADAIFPIISQRDFPKQMSWEAHTDREQTVQFIRRVNQGIADNTGATWAIEHDGKPIGCIGLDGITWQFRAWRVDRAELGFWLAPAAWNKGFMTEAAHAVVRFAFETLGLHKITVGCFAENAASRRVIEKVGFRYLGRHEEDVWRDGAWHAHLRFELLSSEWPDVHTTMRVSRPRPT